MSIVAVILSFVLFVIAGIHSYWAVGGLWPAPNEQALIDMVIGDPRLTQMPSSAMTFLVSAFLFGAGMTPYVSALTHNALINSLAKIALLGIGLIFLGRGAAGYFFSAVAWAPVDPFKTLNLWFYSPLCLAIGAGFISLLFAPSR